MRVTIAFFLSVLLFTSHLAASRLGASPLGASLVGAEDHSNPPGQQIDPDAVIDFVDQFLERERAELEVPGAAFALAVDGKVVLVRGYGYADLENQLPMDPRRTVVRVGSVSKPVTALAALRLVARGELDLHADIDDVLGPELVPDGFDESVTLYHLLSQTAGFGERLFGQHATSASRHLPLRTFLERHLTRRVRPPGLVINYNDYQTSLAGLMVEEATGSPFSEAVRQLVFEPLGMRSTTFEQVDLPGDLNSRLAKAYRSGPTPLARDYVHTTPAAGLYTTAEDMGRFIVALLADDTWDVQQMKQTQFRHGPFMSGRGFGLAEGRSHGYRTLHKDGQCSGFTARILLVPELGVGWFSVQSLSIFGRAGAISRVNGLHRRLASDLLKEFWPEGPGRELPAMPVAAATDHASLPRLAGTYRDTMDPTEGWEGLLLANEVKVAARPDGTLQFLGLEPWQRTELEGDPRTFFYQQDDATALARFIVSETSGQSWVTFRAGAWERLPWYRTASFTRIAAATCLGLLLTALPAFLWLARRPGRLPHGARSLAAAAALFGLFGIGLGSAMLVIDVQVLYSGVTPLLRLVFLLPPVALLLTGVGFGRLIFALRSESSKPRPAAALYWSLVGGASILLSVLLGLNNALGFPL